MVNSKEELYKRFDEWKAPKLFYRLADMGCFDTLIGKTDEELAEIRDKVLNNLKEDI